MQEKQHAEPVAGGNGGIAGDLESCSFFIVIGCRRRASAFFVRRPCRLAHRQRTSCDVADAPVGYVESGAVIVSQIALRQLLECFDHAAVFVQHDGGLDVEAGHVHWREAVRSLEAFDLCPQTLRGVVVGRRTSRRSQ